MQNSNYKKSLLLLKVFVFTAILSVGFLFPNKKANAIFGFGDLVFDIPDIFQNTVSAISGPVVAFGTQPVIAVSGVANTVKEQGLDSIAYVVSKSILKGITAQTVKWINSGFKGEPAFITNPERFFENQADLQMERVLGSQLNTLCAPFSSQIKIALIKQYLQEARPPSCTIDKIQETWENFGKSTKKSSIDDWIKVVSEDNNNPYGAYYKTQDYARIQVNSNSQKYNKQLDYGRGFLSFEKCIARGTSSPQAGQDNATTGTIKQECVERVPLGTQCYEGDADPQTGIPRRLCSGDCIKYKEIRIDALGNEIDTEDEDSLDSECANKETVTPGSVIEGQLQKVFGSSISQLELADEINEIASALMVQMFQRAINGAMGGLRGLTKKNPTETKPFLDRIKAGDTALGTINSSSPESAGEEDSSQIGRINNNQEAITESITPKPTDSFIDPAIIEASVDQQIERYESRYSTTTQSTDSTNDNSQP